jgi:vacuole morphology and inheritance protein 14
MGDAEPILPHTVIRNIGDKLYEKRKQAALEVEQVRRAVSRSGHSYRLADAADFHIENAGQRSQHPDVNRLCRL